MNEKKQEKEDYDLTFLKIYRKIVALSVYKLLRYGIGVVEHAGENTQQVHLIDWGNPEK